jgi:hypothetical protein
LSEKAKKTIDKVSEKQLRRQLGFKKGGDNTFAILEREDGSYVQMLGGGVACCLEWRDTKRGKHFRAFVQPAKVPWKEPSELGQILLSPKEYLFIDDVISAFCAFLNNENFPDTIQWRDITELLKNRNSSADEYKNEVYKPHCIER